MAKMAMPRSTPSDGAPSRRHGRGLRRRRRNRGEQFGNLETDGGSLPGPTVNLQRKVLAVNHLEPLPHVANANPAAIDFLLHLLGNAHAIIDDLHQQAAVATLSSQGDDAAFDLRGDAMPQGI